MELSRTEYPAIVTSVSPVPAVKVIRDRIARGNALNQEVADWLQERRRAEEIYVQALNKLCKRPLPTESPDLGVFAGPWHRIVEATVSVANAHHHLAEKIDTEVERPIREFAMRNTEWSGMKALETNLGTVAKTIDSAEERAEKLKKRGAKAKAQQVADSAAAVSNAYAEWDSQAPFIFEKFQVADEARCNNLKDALTRLQTLELDRTQNSMKAVEDTLSEMLDISTAEEMKAFANKAVAGRQHLERRRSRASNRAGNPSTPSIVTDDSVSVQSSHSGGGAGPTASPAHGLGLKRLGTVLRSRNRHSMFHRSSSPDTRLGDRKHSHSNLQSPKLSHTDSSNLGVPSPSLPGITDETESRPTTASRPATSNGIEEPTGQAKGIITSKAGEVDSLTAQKSSSPGRTITSEIPKTDSEGYSIPPPNHDSVALGDNEPEEHQPQFKVEIKNEVIQEEDEDADAALSKVANTLRAHNTVSRRVRGRRDARDVRNTMYVPNPPEQSESFTSAGSISPPLTPLKIGVRSPIMASEAGSDTQSIRSSRSISSLGAAVVKHPELTQRGLSASLIECVNAAFESATPTKVQVTGEIALAYHSDDNHENSEEHAIIRIDNYAVLEKVAPNPAFLSAVPGNPGEYKVSLVNIRKTSVALKYQVHVDESNRETFPPIVVQTAWKMEPHQSSVILTWKPNPGFKHQPDVEGPLTLHNVAFIVGIEGAHALSCQSKPVGTFSREKARIVWKLNDIHFDPRRPDDGGKMLARFATDGQAKALPAEVRWEMVEFDGMGSGLGISMDSKTATAGEEETDPFADETEKDGADGNECVPERTWTAVKITRRLMGGKYTAS